MVIPVPVPLTDIPVDSPAVLAIVIVVDCAAVVPVKLTAVSAPGFVVIVSV